MNTIFFRFGFVLMSLGCGWVSAQEAEIVKLVSNKVDGMVIYRPSMLVGSKSFGEFNNATDGDARELLSLHTEFLVAMSLASLKDLDEVAFTVTKSTDLQPATHAVIIFRTHDSNEEGFELLCFDAEELKVIDGKEIRVKPEGKGINGFRYVSILDDKTIVWSTSEAGVLEVIQTKPEDHKSASWYEAWKEFENHPVSMGFNSRFVSNLKLIKEEEEQRVGGGGLTLDKTCTLDVKIKCFDAEDADYVEDSLSAGIENANKSLGNFAKKDQPRIVVDLVSLVQKSVKDLEVSRSGLEKINYSLSPDLDPEILGPVVKYYVAKIKEARATEKREKIAHAIRVFEKSYGYLPAPAMEHQGQKHSWRVALLPFLGHSDIYSRYRFDEKWNSPHNQKVTGVMPDVYRNSEMEADTNRSGWFLIYGKSAAIDGDELRTLANVGDGLKNTILAVESKLDRHWAEPYDIPLDARVMGKLGGFDDNGFHALFADGSSHFIQLGKNVDRRSLLGLLTANGGESFELNSVNQKR